MKIPQEIKGKNRLRDFGICLDFIEGKNPAEIQRERTPQLTLRRVQKIIYDNAEFINPRVGWPKARRIHELQRMIDNAPETKKDRADLMDQLRKEIEGDKPIIDQSQHTHVTYNWTTPNQDHNDSVLPAAVSDRHTQPSS